MMSVEEKSESVWIIDSFSQIAQSHIFNCELSISLTSKFVQIFFLKLFELSLGGPFAHAILNFLDISLFQRLHRAAGSHLDLNF